MDILIHKVGINGAPERSEIASESVPGLSDQSVSWCAKTRYKFKKKRWDIARGCKVRDKHDFYKASRVRSHCTNLHKTFVAVRLLLFKTCSFPVAFKCWNSCLAFKLPSVKQLFEACFVIQGEQMPKAIIARTRKDKRSICEGWETWTIAALSPDADCPGEESSCLLAWTPEFLIFTLARLLPSERCIPLYPSTIIWCRFQELIISAGSPVSKVEMTDAPLVFDTSS